MILRRRVGKCLACMLFSTGVAAFLLYSAARDCGGFANLARAIVTAKTCSTILRQQELDRPLTTETIR